MTTPEIARCADGHLRRVIYGLGPYIADYPEQVILHLENHPLVLALDYI